MRTGRFVRKDALSLVYYLEGSGDYLADREIIVHLVWIRFGRAT